MSARQLIVLVVAAIAALGALLLIRGMGANHAQTTAKAEAPIAGEQVLVASADIAQGAAIKPGDLAWRQFPTASVNGAFIRQSAQPSASSEFVGAVARRSFVAGEPIVAVSVVQPNNRGFMAAELHPGFRAVAIKIKPETSAGGFIQPNDHVDVLLTVSNEHSDNSGSSNKEVSSTVVLEDVRVLALDQTTQTQAAGDAPQHVDADIAVLELNPDDARALAAADALGDLSLSLRSVEAGTADATSGRPRLQQHQGTILVHAFGTVSNGGGR